MTNPPTTTTTTTTTTSSQQLLQQSPLIDWILSTQSGIPESQRQGIVDSLNLNGVTSINSAKVLTESEWRELIPLMGNRAIIRGYVKRQQQDEVIRVFMKDDNQNDGNEYNNLYVPLIEFKIGVSWELVSQIIEMYTGRIAYGLKKRNRPELIEPSPFNRSGDYTILFPQNKRINVSSKGVFRTRKEIIEFQPRTSQEVIRTLILDKFGYNPKTVTVDRLVQNSTGHIVRMDSNLIDGENYQLQIPLVSKI
ncbi:hypothetical protein DLAC_09990 [Tieghemostelium lacteum]|uniref:Uncharacterized protein n=1 Tax=Tieghemostelium lacteum TaxID=361077 RepID=A0A151Z5U8_TIELA|nr:hypothetical protein DLAC_09990 [Tieghemostelium lacteum]|eukprot:KYQ89329.1 hypothetical protein DLAC_09990 [Tieghemostelium lacteum]